MNAAAKPDSGNRARRARKLFEALMDVDVGYRAAFVAKACGPDEALRAEVELLLGALDDARTADLMPPHLTSAERPRPPGGEAAVREAGAGDAKPGDAKPGDAKPDPPTLVGARVANYQIVEEIGRGGMGIVYRAQHVLLQRAAAIKVLHHHLSGDGGMVRRFLNEARAVNAIRHPNIVEVLDAGLLEGAGGAPYIVMEFLEGESLAARIEQMGALPTRKAATLGLEIAAALFAAHGKEIIHRDLKPENVFLARHPGGGDTVKVLDFGIAKLRADIAGTFAQTRPGGLLGTPRYMAPEQCRGVASADHRIDIYALGLILFEMLAGVPPFRGNGWAELLRLHLTKPPPPLRERAPGVPQALEVVVDKALAKDPDDRYSSMRAIARALSAAVPTATVPPGFLEGAAALIDTARLPERRAAGGGRRMVMAALAVAALAVGAIAVAMILRHPAPPAAAPAAATPPVAAPRIAAPPAPPPSVPPPAPEPAAEAPASPAAAPEIPPPRRQSERRPNTTKRSVDRSGDSVPDFLKQNPY